MNWEDFKKDANSFSASYPALGMSEDQCLHLASMLQNIYGKGHTHGRHTAEQILIEKLKTKIARWMVGQD